VDDHDELPDRPSPVDRVDEVRRAPRHTGTRARSLAWTGPLLAAAVVVLVVGIALPRPARPADPSPPARLLASASVPEAILPSPAPNGSGPGPVETQRADGPQSATDDGLTMTVAMSGTQVETGQVLVATVTIENQRPRPVVLGLDGCGAPASIRVLEPVPLEPFGRTWDGAAGAFKDMALATGSSGTPVADPHWVYGRPAACHTDRTQLTLASGATIETTIGWTAAIVKGVPAPVGDAPFVISVAHDPSPPPTPAPGPYKCCVGSWIQTYEELTVAGAVSITGDPPRTLSAGQAIDAILGDPRIRAWFKRQPASTWSVTNLLLANDGPAGIIPAGPTWEVDLFREVGVPRNWAIGFIDPFDGTVRQLSFCNDPCDR
jgi:hypothetical protein